MNRNSIQALASGVGVSLVGKLFGRVIALATQIIIARVLGPASFGLYALGLTTLKVTGLFAPLGLDKGVVRFGSRYRENRADFSAVIAQSLFLSIGVGLALTLALLIMSPWLAVSVFQKPELTPVFRWFSPAIGLYSAVRVAAAATTVSQDMRYRVKAEDLVQPGVELALVLAAFVIGVGLHGAIAAAVLSFVVAFLVVVRDLGRIFPQLSLTLTELPLHYRELLQFSIPVALSGGLSILLQFVDRYLVGYYMPTAQVGIYQAAVQSSVLFSIVLQAFNAIFMPMIADLSSADDRTQLQELYRISTKWGVYASLPFFLLMVLMPRDVLGAVFGMSYTSGALPLVLLASGQLVNLSTGAVGLLLIMHDRTSTWNRIGASMVVVNVLLGVVLIPRLGLLGAAISSSISIAGQFLLGLLFVWRDLNLWPYDARYLKGAVSAVAAAGTILAISWVGIPGSFARLAIAGSGSLIVYGLVLTALGLETEDREFFRLFSDRLQATVSRVNNKD